MGAQGVPFEHRFGCDVAGMEVTMFSVLAPPARRCLLQLVVVVSGGAVSPFVGCPFPKFLEIPVEIKQCSRFRLSRNFQGNKVAPEGPGRRLHPFSRPHSAARCVRGLW